MDDPCQSVEDEADDQWCGMITSKNSAWKSTSAIVDGKW